MVMVSHTLASTNIFSHRNIAIMSWVLMNKSKNDKKHMGVLRKYFDKADKDRDGQISMSDWMEALEQAEFPHTQAEVERLFQEWIVDIGSHPLYSDQN